MVKAILADALEQPIEHRAAFVASACADLPDGEPLRGEVERLLVQADRAGLFLEPAGPEPDSEDDRAADLVGRAIDGYTVVRRIAAGGMGTVYEAVQSAPRRTVALKVIQRGLATPAVLRRLLYEAQLLARLDHPGIARVFQAGSYDLGDGARPYLVMEYVAGLTLLEHARDAGLSATERLSLLARIADAVQHAHQRGVIHRDLKPANILVERPETSAAPGNPKVLDFGVARALDADAGLTSMHTSAGELVGTVRYMSPEQLAGDPGAVDTRSDIYALGVIGFELLSGRLPYGVKSGTVVELSRAIIEAPPLSLGSLDRSLRGDVETIVGKALEKDRERRYASAAELAADLRRHLAGEPIAARPPTIADQLVRLGRRHRAVVIGLAATMLALCAGLALSLVQAQRAGREARNAQYEARKYRAVHDFIVNDFLWKMLAGGGAAGPDGAGTERLVDEAEAGLEKLFADEPALEAAVRNQLATMYYNLGLYEKAQNQYARSFERGAEALGPDHPDTLSYANNTALAKMRQGDFAGAEPLSRAAYEGRRRVLGPGHADTLVSMNNLAALLRQTGDLAAAELLLREAIVVQARVRGDHHPDTLTSMSNLGGVLSATGRAAEAETWHRRAVDGLTATLGEDAVTTLVAMSRLAQTLSAQGKAGEAEPLGRRAVAGLQRTLGQGHSHTLGAQVALGEILVATGHADEAVPLLESALDHSLESLGPDHPQTAAARRGLDEARRAGP